MTGIDLGDDQSREALAVLGSRDFSRAFIEEQGILPALLEKNWQNPLKKLWHRDPTDEPDVRDGVRYFLENVLDVDEDKKTQLVTVSVEWTDRDTAARWANLLVERINERMRQRALQESEANVEYLTRELDRTTLVTLQQSIRRHLQNYGTGRRESLSWQSQLSPGSCSRLRSSCSARRWVVESSNDRQQAQRVTTA